MQRGLSNCYISGLQALGVTTAYQYRLLLDVDALFMRIDELYICKVSHYVAVHCRSAVAFIGKKGFPEFGISDWAAVRLGPIQISGKHIGGTLHSPNVYVLTQTYLFPCSLPPARMERGRGLLFSRLQLLSVLRKFSWTHRSRRCG